jgi:predicted metal-dependent phosphoesterase TrpH
MKIDLHSHSTHSDGKETVQQVFEYAAQAGLSALALTDHDTTAGWDEARIEAKKHGITFVPGIEVTTESPDGNSVHLLAYLTDAANQPLIDAMDKVKVDRYNRLIEFVKNLQREFTELNLDVVLNGIDPMKVAVGKPHLADALIALGKFEERGIQFEPGGPLHKGSDHYVENKGIPTLEAIRLVKEAGGVPILAHPLARKNEDEVFQPSEVLRSHFVAMIDAGLAGFEVDHVEVLEKEREWLMNLAQEFDLIMTGSSDYHGMDGKSNRLGDHTTSEIMLKRIEAQATGSSIQWA